MRLTIVLILQLCISGLLYAQRVPDFSSYERVTDPCFKKLLAQFKAHDLPLSTNMLLKEVNLRSLLNGPPLPLAIVEKYLKTEVGWRPWSLDIEAEDLVMGDFYPLYRLPTAGDYVMLVLAQVAKDHTCKDQVTAFAFDLDGHARSPVVLIYQAGGDIINKSITEKLEIQATFVHYTENDSYKKPPQTGKFSALLGNDLSVITENGVVLKLNWDFKPAEFRFLDAECRFVKISP